MEGIDKIVVELSRIKIALIFIVVYFWGLSAYFFCKEVPIWWHSFDRKKRRKRAKKKK